LIDTLLTVAHLRRSNALQRHDDPSSDQAFDVFFVDGYYDETGDAP
jgi:hypothetical protein